MTEAWEERWRTGRTGWHEEQGNVSLRKHWDISGRRVLVPLCGKTVDLLWLENQGNDVVGVELSSLAVEAFFEENALSYSKSGGELTAYKARDRRILIYCGDYFGLQGETFDAHYDRGALIALSPAERPRYAMHTSALLTKDARQLVITLEYDDGIASGPPFPVREAEVRRYWRSLERMESREDIDNAPPKFADAGLMSMREVVWRSRA